MSRPEPVVFEATLTPGLRSAKMFDGIFRAFREKQGVGRLVSLAVVFTSHAAEIRFPTAFATILGALAIFVPRAK